MRTYTLEDDNSKLEVIRYSQENLNKTQISNLTGIPRTTISEFLNKKNYTKWWQEFDRKPIAGGSVGDHHENIKNLGAGTYIAIAAQNNTYVHNRFMDALEILAIEKDAEIICGTFTYNQSGFQNLTKCGVPLFEDEDSSNDNLWYDPRISGYVLNEPVMICDTLMWCGELNILPTAVNPLSGLHSYTRSASGIVPHAKLQLESIPTHKHDETRMMYTTGAVTKRNYVQKKAGQKAEFHHVFGALIIEVDVDGTWFVRQLIAENETGCFYDLDKYYTPNGIYDVSHVEGINWGDLHSEKKDFEVYDVSFGHRPDSMMNVLKPKHQFVHDVLDFTSRNHHNISDPYFRFAKHVHGHDSVKDNILDVIDTLNMMERPYCQTVVVESNHDLALERWLKTSDYKSDPENAIFFLECQLQKYKTLERGEENFSIFEWAVKQNEPNLQHLRFLKTDESFRICDEDGNGIECGQHGHVGNNGARGSISAFQVRGSRYNVGHSHTAAIKDGVYYAGVLATQDMGYNQGGSSWSASSIITYPNGKRAIITVKNGKWRM